MTNHDKDRKLTHHAYPYKDHIAMIVAHGNARTPAKTFQFSLAKENQTQRSNNPQFPSTLGSQPPHTNHTSVLVTKTSARELQQLQV